MMMILEDDSTTFDLEVVAHLYSILSLVRVPSLPLLTIHHNIVQSSGQNLKVRWVRNRSIDKIPHSTTSTHCLRIKTVQCARSL